MLKDFRKKLAIFLSPEYGKEIDMVVDQRVAEVLLRMDPLEPLIREYHGIFSEYFTQPDEKLDDQSRLRLSMWAYKEKHDVEAKYFSEWIMNTAGNAYIGLTNPKPETTAYFRAQIANEMLRKKEIGRLSLYYEEKIKRNVGEDFSGSVVD